MQIQRQPDGSYLFSEVEEPLKEILRAIPAATDADDNADAYHRLYPEPSLNPGLVELRQEWTEYVHPDLRRHFEDATTTVAADLAALKGADTMSIPAAHLDAWLNALNQARLALAARFDVTDEDMDRAVNDLVENERDFALFKIHLYGFVQECLVRGLDEEPGK